MWMQRQKEIQTRSFYLGGGSFWIKIWCFLGISDQFSSRKEPTPITGPALLQRSDPDTAWKGPFFPSLPLAKPPPPAPGRVCFQSWRRHRASRGAVLTDTTSTFTASKTEWKQSSRNDRKAIPEPGGVFLFAPFSDFIS